MSTVPIKTYSKASVERRRLYLDYSCWLEDIEKLTDTQVTISPYTSASPLTVTSAYSDATNKKLVMFISAGVANNNYTVSVVVRTDAGQVKKDDIGIRVTP